MSTSLVYDNPTKLTGESARSGEGRNADIAVLEVAGIRDGVCLTLVYVEHGEDIRIVSFRNASRRERKLYAESREPD